jgi:hypothetical protein
MPSIKNPKQLYSHMTQNMKVDPSGWTDDINFMESKCVFWYDTGVLYASKYFQAFKKSRLVSDVKYLYASDNQGNYHMTILFLDGKETEWSWFDPLVPRYHNTRRSVNEGNSISPVETTLAMMQDIIRHKIGGPQWESWTCKIFNTVDDLREFNKKQMEIPSHKNLMEYHKEE